MKPLFQGINQIGIVTRDLKAMVKRYEDVYGITGWKIQDGEAGFDPAFRAHDLQVRGKPQDYDISLAQAMIGDIEIELIQPLDEFSDYAIFLREHGEGVHHISIVTDDMNKFIEAMKERNVPEVLRGTVTGVETFIYYDTVPEIGMTVEVHDKEHC